MKKLRHTSRREFLQFMGLGAAALTITGGAASFLTSCTRTKLKTGELPDLPFTPLSPSTEDKLLLANGLQYKILAAWGDELNPGLKFGFNNDYTAFFPLNNNPKEGLLCVNFEYPDTQFVSGWRRKNGAKSKQQIETEMDALGVGIIHIREEAPGDWQVIPGSPYNRSVNGRTSIPLISERPIMGTKTALGTMANCAGGITPWGTYLSCEENYEGYYGEVSFPSGKRRLKKAGTRYEWHQHYNQPPEHYGWVVEVNPLTGAAKKLTSMGRFAHESATVVRAKDGRVVAYSGDDAAGEHLYKFVSDSSDSLEKGTLYVADTKNGKWLSLSWKDQKILQKHFQDQTEVLIRAREAAKLLGATPLDRPEDIEICPRTGAVYVALTNNSQTGNHFGSILKVEESGGDYLSIEFAASTFLTGGEGSGFACPDNMAFDSKGNLWITTDMSGSVMNRGAFTPFRNNGLFFVPMSGPQAGNAYLVASAPNDAELTGPTFSPDGRTLFLCVQHPGEMSKDLNHLTSHWPDGGNSIPKPALVAISGKLLDTIQGV